MDAESLQSCRQGLVSVCDCNVSVNLTSCIIAEQWSLDRLVTCRSKNFRVGRDLLDHLVRIFSFLFCSNDMEGSRMVNDLLKIKYLTNGKARIKIHIF